MARPYVTSKNDILHAAIALAAVKGYASVRRDEVAERVGVSAGTVSRQYSCMSAFKSAMVRHSIRHAEKNPDALRVLAQALAASDPAARAAPAALKEKAAELIKS